MHTITVRLKGSDVLYTPQELVVIEVGDFDPAKHEMLDGSPMPEHALGGRDPFAPVIHPPKPNPDDLVDDDDDEK